jgi:hypothetical protein
MKSEKTRFTNNKNDTYYYSLNQHQQQQQQANAFDDLSSSSSSSLLYSPTSDFLINAKDRKKRRGFIEKRRRDRINGCLSELKKLVPEAVSKEASSKLEKAEILQLTVDYLKEFNEAKDDKFKNECKLIGFRDCVLEVSRYLVQQEGLDLQDPLRLRLLSHLQCVSEQNYIIKEEELQLSQSASPQLDVTQANTYPQYVNNSAFVQINITAANTAQTTAWNNPKIANPEVTQFYDGQSNQFNNQQNYWQSRGY